MLEAFLRCFLEDKIREFSLLLLREGEGRGKVGGGEEEEGEVLLKRRAREFDKSSLVFSLRAFSSCKALAIKLELRSTSRILK